MQHQAGAAREQQVLGGDRGVSRRQLMQFQEPQQVAAERLTHGRQVKPEVAQRRTLGVDEVPEHLNQRCPLLDRCRVDPLHLLLVERRDRHQQSDLQRGDR